MPSDFVFLAESRQSMLSAAGAGPFCYIGDCARAGALPSGSRAFDLKEKKKHAKDCGGAVDGFKIRKLELFVIAKSAEFQSVALDGMEELYEKDRKEFVNFFRAVAANARKKKKPIYILARNDMLWDLAFFSDRILR